MKSGSRGDRGFTVLELLVTVSLFTMLMLLLGMVIRGGDAQIQQSQARLLLQESLRDSLYRMGQEIRESSPARVAVANAGASVSFQIPAAVSDGGVITWSNSITYTVGGINNRQLLRTDTGTGQTRVMANDVQSIVFALQGAPVERVSYLVTARRDLTNGRMLTASFTGEARLRNP